MNYRQIYARKAECEKRIKEVCPDITNRPGIYIFYRTDTDSGLRFCYIGQAKRLTERCAQHLQEYDHIALSLKKRGFFDPFNPEANPGGWKLSVWECSGLDALDNAEIEAIREYANNGYQLFNRTAGSQSAGKVIFDNKKPSRGYHDGIKQGEKNTRRFVADLFAKHLDYSPKPKSGKWPTENQIKAMQKFKEFMEAEE
jgi:hypothetical protein